MHMRSELAQALRQLRRQPQSSLGVVAVLAVGIAVSAIVAGMLSAYLLRPSGIEDIDSLVRLRELQLDDAGRQQSANSLSPATWALWREHGTVFEDVAAAAYASFSVTGGDRPFQVNATRISANFLEVLGVEPAIGRGFLVEEDQPSTEPVAIIGHGLWQRHFGGGRDVLNRSIELDGVSHAIVGVLPRGWSHPYEAQVWVPLRLGAAVSEPGQNYLYTPARLAPGVDVATAEQAMRQIASRLAGEFGDLTQADAAGLTPLREELMRDLGPVLGLLGAGAALVLAAAFLNALNLLLARLFGQSKQTAIRMAMGATQSHLFRLAVWRNLLVVLAATALGLGSFLLAGDASRQILGFSAMGEFDVEVRLDAATLVAILAVDAVLVLGLALLEARWLRQDRIRAQLSAGAREGGPNRGHRRLMRGLVVTQLAFALTVTALGALLAQGYRDLAERDRGFQREGLLVFDLPFAENRYPDIESRMTFLDELEQAVEALPGVDAMAASQVTPDYAGAWGARYRVPGQEAPDPPGYHTTNHRVVTPGYLETLGARLLSGRSIQEGDLSAEGVHPVVVSEGLAANLFPDGEAVGRRLDHLRYDGSSLSLRIVGVVAEIEDAHQIPERFRLPFAWYLPLSAADSGQTERMTVIVRTGRPLTDVLPLVRGVVRSMDPDMAMAAPSSMADRLRSAFSRERFSSLFFLLFGVATALVSLVGVYAMFSFMHDWRRREYGIRLAVGARPAHLVMGILRESLIMGAAAVAVGVPALIASSRLAESSYTSLESVQPGLVIISAAVIALLALASSLPAAIRAGRTDPSRQLASDS